ncbi:GntR family transcriptional regulator, partial [Corallococcus sp. 4LFB]
ELLRLAAQTAARPGHLLLIQSLQRAFRGIAPRLLPFLGGESLREWAICAMHALSERNVQALQHQLPVFLKACDERMLNDFAPCPQEHASPEAPHAQEGLVGAQASTTAQDDAPAGIPCSETWGPGVPASASGPDDALETHACVEPREFDALAASDARGGALETPPCVETGGPGIPAPDTGQDDARVTSPCVETGGPGIPSPDTGQDEVLEARLELLADYLA